jgi:uncharacterized protein (TIGR00251 family)
MDEGKRSTCSPVIETHVVPVRVTPRGGRDAIAGWQDSALRVRLAAAPVDGRANDSLVRFLAKVVGVTPSSVRLVSGGHSRSKRIAFDGIDAGSLRRRLGIPAEVPFG